jgi:hypothetical protein
MGTLTSTSEVEDKMKITKAYLKKLIKEEIAALNEGAPRRMWYGVDVSAVEENYAKRRLEWWVTNVLNKPENYNKFGKDIEKIFKNRAGDYGARDFDLVMRILSSAIRDPKKMIARNAKAFEDTMDLYNIDLKKYGYRKRKNMTYAEYNKKTQ